jgi:hypothetical protein
MPQIPKPRGPISVPDTYYLALGPFHLTLGILPNHLYFQ